MNNITNKILKATFGWMSCGLLVTALIAYLVGDFVLGNIESCHTPVLSNAYGWGWLASVIAEFCIVWKFAKHTFDYSTKTLVSLFLFFSVLNGITLSPIAIVYAGVDIFVTFLTTFALFAVMGIIGYATKIDLSKYGSILLMGLIGLVIATIVCIFVANSILYWCVTVFGTLLFVCIIAYDINELKNNAEDLTEYNDVAKHMALSFALDLYLDFINLFLLIIRYVTNTK